MTARDCVELGENGEALVLAARFDRAGAGHAVMIVLDLQECGEAAEILLLDSSELTGALGELRRAAKRDKVRLTSARRKTKDGPAPVFQLRVDLRGSKPPIWRRLQVPGDITLGELHTVFQVAFDWDSAHLYAFDTAYGQFGVPDPGLGVRSDTTVTLEQVTATAGTKLTYTYDFGDDWEHVITVEDTVARADASIYPRCIGGRRKAPPEDCGGIWGYYELLAILDDPAHEEHHDRLESLGIDRPDQHDPAHFDPGEVNDAFTALRQNSRRQK